MPFEGWVPLLAKVSLSGLEPPPVLSPSSGSRTHKSAQLGRRCSLWPSVVDRRSRQRRCRDSRQLHRIMPVSGCGGTLPAWGLGSPTGTADRVAPYFAPVRFCRATSSEHHLARDGNSAFVVLVVVFFWSPFTPVTSPLSLVCFGLGFKSKRERNKNKQRITYLIFLIFLSPCALLMFLFLF